MDTDLFRCSAEMVADAVILVDGDDTIRFANLGAAAALGRDPQSLNGTPLSALCDRTHRNTLARALKAARSNGRQTVDPDPVFGDVSGRDGALHLDAPTDGGHVVVVRRLASVPEPGARRLHETQDPVTGLLNRHSLPVVIRRELDRARRLDVTPVALLFVMLRDFKHINQMHGHQVGDLLLENSGVRVRETVRKSDYVFRWEGTNLVVLLPELATRLDGLIVAEKIHSAVTVPYRFRGLDLAPGCHIGIALFPDDAGDGDTLFNRANSAVIEAERRNEPFLYFDEETHRRASDRLTLKTGLQRAFERNELELYYQPIVYPDGRMAGAEALMRWNHPTRGVLGPGSFLDLAEDSRLITPIDKLALYTTCRQLVEWSRYDDFFLSLNISAINLSDASLPTVVAQAVKDSGLTDPSRLKIELTESRTAEDRPRFLTVMDEIRSMGVDIWIDDFGTGQSSLSYLKHLPISTVKIDKDFVAELCNDKADVDYLQGIISTVQSRYKRIVVEGVSNERQLSLVGTLPVDYLQGFHFARPMPAKDLGRLLERGAKLPVPSV